MKIHITEEAELDLTDGYWFCERQTPGLGDYFRSALIADIDSLAFFAGIHEHVFGYHRSLSNLHTVIRPTHRPAIQRRQFAAPSDPCTPDQDLRQIRGRSRGHQLAVDRWG